MARGLTDLSLVSMGSEDDVDGALASAVPAPELRQSLAAGEGANEQSVICQ